MVLQSDPSGLFSALLCSLCSLFDSDDINQSKLQSTQQMGLNSFNNEKHDISAQQTNLTEARHKAQ